MLKKIFLVVLLLVVTNGATAFWLLSRHRLEMAESQRLLEGTASRGAAVHAELEKAREALRSSDDWSGLVAFQRQVVAIDEEVVEWNFGLALEGLDTLESARRGGEYGETLAAGDEVLEARIAAVRETLTSRSDESRRALVELSQRALSRVAGLEMEASPTPEQPEATEMEEAPTAPAAVEAVGEVGR